MSSLSNTVNMSIRIDKNVKKDADSLFKDLGINTTSAINMFLKQCIRDQKLPFVPSLERPSDKLVRALEESEKMAHDSNLTGYKSTKELIEALDSDL